MGHYDRELRDPCTPPSVMPALFNLRDLAVILVAVDGEMTEVADRLVPQETWDELHDDGYIFTGRVYTRLTKKGLQALDSLFLIAAGEA